MDRKAGRLLWLSIAWGAGIGIVITLLSTYGTLQRTSVISLVILGGLFFTGAVLSQGWLRAPVPVGTPVRAAAILALIWGGMVVLGVLALANPQPAKRAHIRIDNFEFLKVVARKQMGINLFFRNDGDVEAIEERSYAAVARTTDIGTDPADARKVEDYLWNQFTSSPKQRATPHNLPPHSMGMWATFYGDALDEWQVSQLKQGKFVIWFMGTVVYRDTLGERTTQFCSYYKGNPKVVFACEHHNGDAEP
jgi:hypothetical protein